MLRHARYLSYSILNGGDLGERRNALSSHMHTLCYDAQDE